MFMTFVLFGGVAVFAVAATLFQLARDGHRRVPERHFRTLP
jgi:hypothetical protein